MSRTRKDAPYRVREDRLGIKDKKENCSLCSEAKDRIIITGFTAIFFAHEIREIEQFLELAADKGYSSEIREIRGYLGTSAAEDALTPRYSSSKSAFEGYLDPKRAIYSQPRGITDNLLWNSAGRFSSQTQVKQRLTRIFGRSSDAFELFDAPFHVSHKENIFTVISISKETQSRGYNFHYHGADGLSYLLYGHCHCSSCAPDEKGAKSKVRSIAIELRNAFNSGEYEVLDEIAAELAVSGANGYRDEMNC